MLAGPSPTCPTVPTIKYRPLSSLVFAGDWLTCSCTPQLPCKHPLFVPLATLLLVMTFKLKSLSPREPSLRSSPSSNPPRMVSGRKLAGLSPTSPPVHLLKSKLLLMPTSSLLSSTSSKMPISRPRRKHAGRSRMLHLAVSKNPLKFDTSLPRAASSLCVISSL